MRKLNLLSFGALALVAMAPAIHAATIQGTTAGSTVTGTIGDDIITNATTNITYQTFCSWIVNGATAYASSNFLFAGYGAAAALPQIDAGDFTIAQYTPWIGSSNNGAGGNSVTGPDTKQYSRGVTNQEAWGANIVINYTPLGANDPKNVNFVQAYVESTNGGVFSNGKIDSSSATSPYYNKNGVAGTGTTNRTGTVPLVTNNTTAAWLVDIPYDCENGPAGVSNADCTGGVDDTLTSQSILFQTFIESDWVNPADNKTYQVLYGGVQWGYVATTVDTPEPRTIAFIGSALLLTSFVGKRHSRKSGRSV
jgi:hypothetical protein